MPTATLAKFNILTGNLGLGVYNLNTDSLKLLLTNTIPNVADIVVDTTTTPCTVKATSNAVELAAGNGYTKGGTAIAAQAYVDTAGVSTLAGNAVVFTAAGGNMGPFRYVVLYDNTAGTTATRPVIGWLDSGGSNTLTSGQTFTVAAVGGGNWTSTLFLIKVQ